jgi:hypothetical protein
VYQRLFSTILISAALLAPLSAKNKKAPVPDPKDEIQVVGHIPLTGGQVKRFFTTQHYSSYYLYAEHETGGNVTLIDITKTSRPAVLADVAYGARAQGISVVAGTAALVTSEAIADPQPAPQVIRIMDFSDPKNPKVAREFAGVTAVSRDDRRGLIFVANAEGIWILQQHLAEDPEVEKAYANYVIYGASMYPPK